MTTLSSRARTAPSGGRTQRDACPDVEN
jgi:hypothetical protein